jgi:hypothetical protein
MNRTTVFAVIGIATLALTLATAEPATAQIVPPGRNAVGFSLATYSAAPLYSFGAAFAVNPAWDATLAFSFQSTPSTSGNLFGLGVRYHFNVPAPGVDVYLAGGLASASGTLPGFGTLSGTGIFAGGGATLKMASLFSAYVRASVYALGGTSNAIADLGVQATLAPLVSGQVGYISLAGNGALYVGVVVQMP